MVRKYIRMSRKDYEKQMRNTELYFLGEVPENECCPTCGEHDFFIWDDFSHSQTGKHTSAGHGIVVKTRQTGRELLDYVANPKSSWEHMRCACCRTSVKGDVKNNRIVWNPKYVHYTREQFKEALDARYGGDIDKYLHRDSIMQSSIDGYLREHFPEQSKPPKKSK